MLDRDELLAEAITTLRGYLDREHPWRLDALCREPGYETATFYPARGESTEAARAVCARCPVTAECFTYAVQEKHGLWGGLSGRERRGVRARRQEAA